MFEWRGNEVCKHTRDTWVKEDILGVYWREREGGEEACGGEGGEGGCVRGEAVCRLLSLLLLQITRNDVVN